MRPDIEDKLRLCPQLPSLSGVALRLVQLARNPEIELGEITGLLLHDPALAARILRVANSPLYSHYQRAQSLDQALRILGLNTTITLSLGFSLTSSLRQVHGSGVDLEAFWRRALISALAAQSLGDQCSVPAREELFLAALLQDIGRLALDVALPGSYPIVDDSEVDQDALIALEREHLGTDHVEVGAWLVSEWHLPDYFCRAIENSHDQGRSHGLGELTEFLSCVTASGPIADIYITSDPAVATAKAQAVTVGCLGLTAPDLDSVLNDVMTSLPEVESLFQMTTLSPSQAEGLTAQAREIITCRHLKSLEMLQGQLPGEKDSASKVSEQLYDMAYRDPLTNVFNRRHFDQQLKTAFAGVNDSRHPLSVAFLDMDGFKAVNDEYGHLAGDTVIAHVANVIGDHLRTNDLLARYGGDEFVVLLPGIATGAAADIVERICNAIADTRATLANGETVAVTMSAGIAAHDNHLRSYAGALDLINAADQALCEAKRQGRNRVIQASSFCRA